VNARPATSDPPDIRAAPDELLALARAVRPAWDCDILAAALLAAKNAGWTWDRTLAETVRLLRDPGGSPWDLKRAAADPFCKATVPPGTGQRGAAAARRLLGYDQPAPAESSEPDWYDPNGPDPQFCPGCRARQHCNGGTSFCECSCTTAYQAGAAS
jgi:hypothetical protein